MSHLPRIDSSSPPDISPELNPVTNLLVLGGSGRTGTHVLAQAASRGHRVRALVRNPDTVQAPPTVELIQGTPMNIDDLRKAAQGTQAVISVLSNARASDNPWAKPTSPPTFMTDAAQNTLEVMGEQGIRRIVLASTQGAGDDWNRLTPVVKAFVKLSNLKIGFADHDALDHLVRASGTDWTLARAVALSDKPAFGPLRAEGGNAKPGPRVNRADLAGFLLDAVEQGSWIRQAPLIWNARSALPHLIPRSILMTNVVAFFSAGPPTGPQLAGHAEPPLHRSAPSGAAVVSRPAVSANRHQGGPVDQLPTVRDAAVSNLARFRIRVKCVPEPRT
ncbi:putative flavin reductase [Mycobacteroides abscessus]|uniref:NAD(P)-dependent oxidoreductase n=1 Tax=Mycobacteroides abscessus TaxID=36809 RepID=UPI0005EA4473|nr:NAD(P)H-binding protein [Mycobacteroides abscessus]CPX34638.1 putative flavin reductase [Mycobacteroides abscessus]CPZ49021.1 putative flavin reductase [Mycobacteroides abscessus]